MHRQLQIRPLSHVEEFLDLIDVVEAALEGFLFGSIDPIGDIIDHVALLADMLQRDSPNQ